MGAGVNGIREVPTPDEDIPVPVQYSALPFTKFSVEKR